MAVASMLNGLRDVLPGVLPMAGMAMLAAAVLAGCGMDESRRDPFGRPYSADNLLTSIRLSCDGQGLDAPALLISGTRPVYPAEMDMNNIVGDIVIRLTVNVDGTAHPIKQDSKETPWFYTHARIAMTDWKLQPAVKGGKPVQADCVIGFRFGE